MRSFFADRDVLRADGSGRLNRFPFKEAGSQSLAKRFAGFQAKYPLKAGMLEIQPGRVLAAKRDDASAVFMGYAQSIVARIVVNDQNFIAGIQRFQGAAQLPGIVKGVQQCGERGHGIGSNAEESLREVRDDFRRVKSEGASSMQIFLRRSSYADPGTRLNCALDLFPANHKPYKLRRKFRRSCCCEELRELKLLITVFASELQLVLEVSGSKTLLVVRT